MKTLLGVVFMVTMLFVSPKAHALFGHVAAEKERRQQAERQNVQEQKRLVVQQHLATEQQQRANHWQMVASILGIVAVVMLIAGTAIGSRGRHHAARRE